MDPPSYSLEDRCPTSIIVVPPVSALGVTAPPRDHHLTHSASSNLGTAPTTTITVEPNQTQPSTTEGTFEGQSEPPPAYVLVAPPAYVLEMPPRYTPEAPPPYVEVNQSERPTPVFFTVAGGVEVRPTPAPSKLAREKRDLYRHIAVFVGVILNPLVGTFAWMLSFKADQAFERGEREKATRYCKFAGCLAVFGIWITFVIVIILVNDYLGGVGTIGSLVVVSGSCSVWVTKFFACSEDKNLGCLSYVFGY